jgi:hypothetical protein
MKFEISLLSFSRILKKFAKLGAGGVAHRVKCLPSKCKVLNSNTSITKKNNFPY